MKLVVGWEVVVGDLHGPEGAAAMICHIILSEHMFKDPPRTLLYPQIGVYGPK